jgi:hypothetical protein
LCPSARDQQNRLTNTDLITHTRAYRNHTYPRPLLLLLQGPLHRQHIQCRLGRRIGGKEGGVFVRETQRAEATGDVQDRTALADEGTEGLRNRDGAEDVRRECVLKSFPADGSAVVPREFSLAVHLEDGAGV